MTQYYRHPEGKKNAQLQKRVAELCRLLRARADDAKVRGAAAEVRDAFWRVYRQSLSRVTPEDVRWFDEMNDVVHRVPLEHVIDGCSACIAAGKEPDGETAATWFRRPGPASHA